MLLRDARVSDVEALSDAWYAMLDEAGMLRASPDPQWRELVGSHFRRGIERARQHWAVIELDGAVVATGGLFFMRERSIVALTGLYATLAGIYTYPHVRCRGYARAIVAHLIARARAEGCNSLRLRATDSGRPIYEKLGFVPGDEMLLRLS